MLLSRVIAYYPALKRSVSFGVENNDTLSFYGQYVLWQSGGKYFIRCIAHWNSTERCKILTGNRHK